MPSRDRLGKCPDSLYATSLSTPSLSVDTAPHVVFRIITDENDWKAKDKLGYVSRHRYATEAGRATGPGSALKPLFLELCCQLWNVEVDAEHHRVELGPQSNYNQIRSSNFLSTATGIPWLTSKPSAADPDKPAALIAIDLHAVIRAGVRCFDFKNSARNHRDLAQAFYKWKVNYTNLSEIGKTNANNTFHTFLDSEPRTNDIFIEGCLPFSCIIGTYDWKKVQSGLQRSEWLLGPLTQPPPLAVTQSTDPRGLRRGAWKAGKSIQPDKMMPTDMQTNKIYAELGQRLRNILEEHVYPSNEKIKLEAVVDQAIDVIFRKYIELELELYTAVSTHVKLCINGVALTFKKSDNSAHHQPFQAFHAKATPPTNVNTCSSIILQIIDWERAETISATCQISTNEIDSKKHPVISFEGNVNTLLSKAVSPSVPMNQITKLFVHVNYTLAKLEHRFVIEMEHPQR